jgi:hypothetical protein
VQKPATKIVVTTVRGFTGKWARFWGWLGGWLGAPTLQKTAIIVALGT